MKIQQCFHEDLAWLSGPVLTINKSSDICVPPRSNANTYPSYFFVKKYIVLSGGGGGGGGGGTS